MAIKIDGQDLLKKFIGGQEIVKIYRNGGEIRPNTVPPTPIQPTYHIMGDFATSAAGGSLPNGWSSDYGSVSYSNDGISLDTTGGTDHVTIKNQNSMPSLENASRVKIDYDFYRTGASTQALYPYLRLQGGIYENLYDRRSLQSSVFFDSPDYAAQEWHTVDTGSYGGLSFELGKYTLSIDVDLMNGVVTQTITSPNQTTATISRDDVHIVPNMEAIRHSDEFRITLYEGITISDMNMYIWYRGDIEISDFTQGSMPSGRDLAQGNIRRDSNGIRVLGDGQAYLIGPTPPDLSRVSKIIMSYTYKVYSNGERSDIILELERPDPERGFYQRTIDSHLIAFHSPEDSFLFILDSGEEEDREFMYSVREANVITTIDLDNLVGETSIFDKNGNWLGNPCTVNITSEDASKIRESSRLSLELLSENSISYVEKVSITYVI